MASSQASLNFPSSSATLAASSSRCFPGGFDFLGRGGAQLFEVLFDLRQLALAFGQFGLQRLGFFGPGLELAFGAHHRAGELGQPGRRIGRGGGVVFAGDVPLDHIAQRALQLSAAPEAQHPADPLDHLFLAQVEVVTALGVQKEKPRHGPGHKGVTQFLDDLGLGFILPAHLFDTGGPDRHLGLKIDLALERDAPHASAGRVALGQGEFQPHDLLLLGGGFAVEALLELEAGALGAGFDFPELEMAAFAGQGQVGGPPQMGLARSVQARD